MEREGQQCLVMCQGIAASGKSTYARQMVEAEPERFCIVEKDLLRFMLHGWNTYRHEQEPFIRRLRDLLVLEILDAGFSPIVADCNLGPHHEPHLRELVTSRGIPVVIADFTDVPLTVCLTRNASRQIYVPEKAIIAMYERYIKDRPGQWEREEAWLAAHPQDTWLASQRKR